MSVSRTSVSQFEILVEFMERHGDLNKPRDGPSGRLHVLKLWEELAGALNVDATGSSRTIEKWKKVWSDLKNNSKRKAAKINRAATGTGGGAACKLVLSELEQRVLQIIGPQSATGLTIIHEVGLELPTQPPSPLPSTSFPPPGDESNETSPPLSVDNGGDVVNVDFIVENTSTNRTQYEATSRTREFGDRGRRSVSTDRRRTSRTREFEDRGRRSVSTDRRRQSNPNSRYSRARPQRPHRIDAATQQFLASDQHWRSVVEEFLRDHIRLREAELQQNAQWQLLFAKCLDVLEKFKQ